MPSKPNIAIFADWITIGCFFGSLRINVSGLMRPSLTLPGQFGLMRVQSILLIGLIAVAMHALLAEGGQKILLHMNYHAGAGRSLPQGRDAVLLSMSMTVPLVLAPMAYSGIFHVQVVQSNHYFSSAFVVVGASVGHLVLYGIKAIPLPVTVFGINAIKFPGLKPMIFPLSLKNGLFRPLIMEVVFAAIHFSSIVLIYRYALSSNLQQPVGDVVMPTVESASLWLFFVISYFLLTYPETVKDKRTIERRGVVNGLLLVLTLEAGMLM